MSSKQKLLGMAVAYLALTIYLFLTSAGIDVMLLFAIFSYIFYTPLAVLFKNSGTIDIQDIDSPELNDYISLVIYTLIGFLLLYATGIFSAETFLKIMKYIVSNLPQIELPNLGALFKSMNLQFILITIAIVVIFRVLLLYILAGFVIYYIVVVVFNMLLGFVVIILYFLASLGLLGILFYIAYRGHQVTKDFVKENSLQEAIVYFSAIGSGVYLFLMFYINLFTLH